MRSDESGGVTDMFFLKEIADDLRLSLAAVQVTAHAGHHLRAVARTGFPQGIGFDILVEQFVWIELRTITRQSDQAQSFGMGIDEPFGHCRAVYRMTYASHAGSRQTSARLVSGSCRHVPLAPARDANAPVSPCPTSEHRSCFSCRQLYKNTHYLMHRSVKVWGQPCAL